jgi:thioredoxin-related protein
VQAQLEILAHLEHGGLERPEVAREVELAVVGEGLVREDQHCIPGEGGADRGEVVGAQRAREIDIADFGDEIRSDSDGRRWPRFPPDPVFDRDWTTEGARPQMAFMTRILSLFAILLLGMAERRPAAPLDNKDGFWSEWSEATFDARRAEKKFVIVSLQSWWCPWCLTMNKETWADPEVRAELKDHFIPVQVDQDSRPDISQRYERWGWPATIIFGPDGTEIVKLRGFYSPKFFIPVLQETVKDPSPVDYGEPGGPERERTLGDRPDGRRAQRHSGLHEQGLGPGQCRLEQEQAGRRPTLGWFLDAPRPATRRRPSGSSAR